MNVRHNNKIFNAAEFRNLLNKFNFTPSDTNTSLLVNFCNNSNHYPGIFNESMLNLFQFFWNPQKERFYKKDKTDESLKEELEICKNFLILFKKILQDNGFVEQFKSKFNYTQSEKVWLILYGYLSNIYNPNPLKTLFTMLCSSHYYRDDQLLKKIKEINHFWIYSLELYLKYDIIDGDLDLKGDLTIQLKEILKPIKDSIFLVNNLITLKLENGETNIYIKGELFRQCKSLFIRLPKNNIQESTDYNSIDELAIYFNSKLEYSPSYEITPEEEFWGHCSNLQAWVEHDYDTRLLHSNLSFPLLRRLAQAGDTYANQIFKEEIVRRLNSDYLPVINYLIETGYLEYLTQEEMKAILEQDYSPLVKLRLKLERAKTCSEVGILKKEITHLLKAGDIDVLRLLIREELLLYFSSNEINSLLEPFVLGYDFEIFPQLKLAAIIYNDLELFLETKCVKATIDDLFSRHRTLSEKLRLDWLISFSAQLWTAFLEQHPTIWKAWYLLGLDLLDTYNRSKGFQAFNECLDLITEKTIKISISDKDVIEHILDLSMDWGEKLLTIRTLFALIQIFPENIEYIFDLTQLLFIYNEYEKAEMILRRSLKKNKKNSNILYLLSFSLWYQKKFGLLIPILKKLLKIDKKSSISLFLLMIAYREVGNFKKAKKTEELLIIQLYNESKLKLDFKILQFVLYKQKNSSGNNLSSYSFIWYSKLLAQSFKYHKKPIYDENYLIKSRL